MSRLRVMPIVEGHGEEAAVRVLLPRVWTELLGGEYLEVVRPIREKRGRLVQKKFLQPAVELAFQKLANPWPIPLPGLVLLLLDGDEDCAAELGPELAKLAGEGGASGPFGCVVAVVEYETWFVAAAESLSRYLDLPVSTPSEPEKTRAGKGWIQKHFKKPKYSETVDQPALSATMDLSMCRSRSPSFDKLCRELGKQLNLP